HEDLDDGADKEERHAGTGTVLDAGTPAKPRCVYERPRNASTEDARRSNAAAAVSQQLGAPGVRGPLGAEREIGDRRQSCFLAHHYLEGAAPVAATRPEQLAREE